MANHCQACTTPEQCKGLSTDRPYCDKPSGSCHECLVSKDCKGDPHKPICIVNLICDRCQDDDACRKRDSATPACKMDTGSCVDCTNDSHCSGTTPICHDDNKCHGCTNDTECMNKPGPGICMTNGHCATPEETAYVAPIVGCTGTGNGSTASPFCQTASAISSGKRVIVLRGSGFFGAFTAMSSNEVSVIAQGSDVSISGGSGGPGIRATAGGRLYVRGVTVTLSAPEAIWADGGATIRLDRVTVSNNVGGILIEGASFDIRNSRVIGNGPGPTASVGGILIRGVAQANPKVLERVSVQNNSPWGINCDSRIDGRNVFADGDVPVTSACMFTACTPPSATCGAP
jgi:hypothetical protein